VSFGKTTPILRILDEAKAREFYVDFLGFNVDWEHRFESVPRLMDYAARFRMLTLMANQADSVSTFLSVGKSAAWAPGASGRKSKVLNMRS